MQLNTIYQGHALEVLRTFPAASVDCCVTSPPYWGLRDYGVPPQKFPECRVAWFGLEMTFPAWEGCFGLEPTPEMFVAHLVLIFEEIYRVLKPTGTVWLNLGDSYANRGRNRKPEHACKSSQHCLKQSNKITGGLKAKDLVGIPWMAAFALRDTTGWYLRQDIIWNKPNPMPESVNDRCTRSHEYFFLLSKKKRYYFNAWAIATPYKDKTLTTFGHESKGRGDGSGLVASENWSKDVPVRKPKEWKTPDGWDTTKGSHGSFHKDGREKGRKGYGADRSIGLNGSKFKGHSGNHDAQGNLIGTGKANKRSVWTISAQAFAGNHFATFPEKLVVDPIKAGCPTGGTVLDPFMGSGTTGLVAQSLECNYVGIDLKPENLKMADERMGKRLGLFHKRMAS